MYCVLCTVYVKGAHAFGTRISAIGSSSGPAARYRGLGGRSESARSESATILRFCGSAIPRRLLKLASEAGGVSPHSDERARGRGRGTSPGASPAAVSEGAGLGPPEQRGARAAFDIIRRAALHGKSARIPACQLSKDSLERAGTGETVQLASRLNRVCSIHDAGRWLSLQAAMAASLPASCSGACDLSLLSRRGRLRFCRGRLDCLCTLHCTLHAPAHLSKQRHAGCDRLAPVSAVHWFEVAGPHAPITRRPAPSHRVLCSVVRPQQRPAARPGRVAAARPVAHPRLFPADAVLL